MKRIVLKIALLSGKQSRGDIRQRRNVERELKETSIELERRDRRINYPSDCYQTLEHELRASRGTIEKNISDCENYGEGCSFIEGKVARHDRKFEDYTMNLAKQSMTEIK